MGVNGKARKGAYDVVVTLRRNEHRWLRMAAAHEGVAAGELVARWAKRYLARHGIRTAAPEITDMEGTE